MTLWNTFVGALLLKNETFLALRARSDVFLRGFMVLLVTALVVGVFTHLGSLIVPALPTPSKAEIEAQATAIYNQQYRGPENLRQVYEVYVTDIASLAYDLLTTTPNGGEAGRWFGAIAGYVGQTLALAWTGAFAGWMLLAGLVVQLTSRWLGGRAGMAQMLGLTALAAAPQIFTIVTALLSYLATTSGIAVLGTLGSLVGFVIALWGAVIYIKATAVAQQFSAARAIGAIVLAWVVAIGIALALVILVGIAIALFVVPIARVVQ